MENRHVYRADEYPNLLDSIPGNSDTLHRQIKNYPLQFFPKRNRQVEWEIQFPMFVKSFYEFILREHRIPTQQEFHAYYCKDIFFRDHRFSEEIMCGLKARVCRTYPSLVRDICFNKYVQENMKGYQVVYNLKLDVVEGIDLMISRSDRNWGINLYTDTKGAYIGRKAKAYRHRLFDNVTYVELPINFKSCVKLGGFYLYGKREYDELIKRLQ